MAAAAPIQITQPMLPCPDLRASFCRCPPRRARNAGGVPKTADGKVRYPSKGHACCLAGRKGYVLFYTSSSCCLGGLELVPSHGPLLILSPYSAPCYHQVDYTKDFFSKPAYLTVSGQLNGGLGCLHY